jgi:hypothetical protein
MAKVKLAQLHELGEQIKRGQIPAWKARAVFGLSEKETETPLDMYLALTKAAKAELMTAEQLQALLEGKDEVLGIYKVTVDYNLTLEQMIAAGKYDWATDERFPVLGKGKVERELVLVHLNKVASTDEVLAEIDRRGLKSAEIEDLLVLGAVKPELQRRFSIMELGSSWGCSRNGLHYFAFIDHDNFGRVLRLLYCGNGWGEERRFLAVRKDAA